MAEEDEIDIMGDFILDRYDAPSLVSENTELLNLDYTIHPQWLLDKPSTNPENWYGSNLSSGLLDRSQTENDNQAGLVSTEDSITDESGWTEKEKNLLERGIEIFGKSNVRLAQFIGSKTATEVKHYLKNFYVDSTTTYRLNEGIIEENNENLIGDIPVSVEEVITVVSTAKPTVGVGSKKTRKKSISAATAICKNIPSGQSVLKSKNTTKDSKAPKVCKPKQPRNKAIKAVKFKFKVTTNQTEIKQKTIKVMNDHNKKAEVGRVEITTGAGLSVPVCEGEEVVTLNRAPNEGDSDEDLEIDVEETDDIPAVPVKPNEISSLEQITQSNDSKIIQETTQVKPEIDLDALDESTRKQLTSMEEPKEEVVFRDEEITTLEKIIHADFFEGSQAKTPKRYLKIRNHILNMWEMEKPSYVTKTSTRQGLKNCGDVNCIGRVHNFLEQIGGINFGCSQVNYVRPLYDMIQVAAPTRENKQLKPVHAKPVSIVGSRQRIKRKLNNDGEGGCTMTHDESGKVISTTIVNEEPVQRQKSQVRKGFTRLINCKSFTEEHPQKYSVKLHLSTLLLMDFHAHSSLTEIMGLIGGHWFPEENTLKICHYEPCKNIASSATHCDMCPISQAKASDLIHSKDLDILGWFHSHPTFIPEPSQQDLDTQQVVQTWIGNNKPCLGFILSPFSLNGALIASPYRCMMVEKKQNFEDQFVPYKYRVELVTNGFDVQKFLDEVSRLYCQSTEEQAKTIDFTKPYFQDSSITYSDKFVSSVRMYLAKCDLNNIVVDSVIEGISRIFEDKT